MNVRFLQYYQGAEIDPLSYHPGDEADLDDELAERLIGNRQAEEIKPKRTVKGASDAKK